MIGPVAKEGGPNVPYSLRFFVILVVTDIPFYLDSCLR
jgi:hypothetical protein